MTVNVDKNKFDFAQLVKTLKEGTQEEIAQATQSYQNAVAETVMEKLNLQNQAFDRQILQERGVHQLTSDETKFYEKFVQAAKSTNPKQAITDLLNVDGGMPETIIEDVFRDLTHNHVLLSKVKYQNVKYLTKWLLNNATEDMAVWGEINSEITKEIQGGFKSIEITQGKLSAFLVIAKDMLDLGHAFIDAYIKTILKEALAYGLEYGILKGKGVKGEPIGMIRDIHNGVSVNTETGYPLKTKIAVKSFETKEYCNLVSTNLVKKENGKYRKIAKLTMIVNPLDYVGKVVPATTVLTADGRYVHDLFPMATEVIQSTALDEGEAVLTIIDEYFLGLGSSNKDGVIEYSDQYQFLEDTRVFKIKLHAFGRCEDNTSAVYLDITNLEAAYVLVKEVVASA